MTTEAVKCHMCGKTRTDEPDYNPLQVIFDEPRGWFSGGGEEICPEDFERLYQKANGA